VQLLGFVNDRLFSFIYISDSKNRGFVVEKKIKIKELLVWVISETSKNQQFPSKNWQRTKS
jgi:hypothetical protein